MKHSDAQTQMMEALDGVLSPAGRAALGTHLVGCAECRRLWQEFQRVDGVLAQAAQRPAPAGFSRRVMLRLDGPVLSEQWSLASWTREDWLRALAGLGVLFVAGLAVAAWLLFSLSGPLAVLLQGSNLPQQLPAILAALRDWYVVISALGRALLTLLSAADTLLRMNPGLFVIALAALGVVALWAWMLQRLASGETSGQTSVML